jgi:RNA polymerase sigma-70 factor, ECF subfamily
MMEDGVKSELSAKTNGEADLVRRGMRGDAQALEVLFSRYLRTLYPTALKVLGNPEDAEDAVQEGLLAAFRNLGRFEGRSQFSTWLTRIVINASLMRLRSRRARPVASLDDSPLEQPDLTFSDLLADPRLNPEDAYTQQEFDRIFKEGLEALPAKLRSPVVLRDVQGFSTEQAAQKLHVSEGTLKSRLHRARAGVANAVRRRLLPARRSRAVPQSRFATDAA